MRRLFALLPLALFLAPADAQTARFSNQTPIVIPLVGSAQPYPSSIQVVGQTAPIGAIEVRISQLTHTFADDIDILLVAPDGRATWLMSDAGGSLPVTNATVNFRNGAPPIPNAAQLPGSVLLDFSPADYDPGETIAPPAPPPPSGGTHPASLAQFLGSDPNGTWSLYVFDDAAGDQGQIAGGWDLYITPAPGSAPRPAPTAIEYQGVLADAAGPVASPVDLRFTLFSHPTAGLPAAAPVGVMAATPDAGGRFRASVDFGPAAFADRARWLQIEVRAEGGEWSTLEPRQPIAPAPQARWAAGVTIPTALGPDQLLGSLLPFGPIGNGGDTAENNDPVALLRFNRFGDGSELFLALGNEGNSADAFRIGYFTTNAQGAPLQVDRFRLDAAGNAFKTGGGSWAVLSDPAAKHDIRPLAGTLDKLLGLRGYSFLYNDSAVAAGAALPGVQVGLMADEVARVFPDWVSLRPDGLKQVTERSTTALMVEALRDLRAEKDAALAHAERRIQALEAENAARAAAIAELRARLDALEQTGSARPLPR